MTDSEIIKALECCSDQSRVLCKGCPLEYEKLCGLKLTGEALTLIKCQQAEIERLKAEHDALIRSYKECAMEAVRDFAKGLKAKAYPSRDWWRGMIVEVGDIDALIAEMEGNQ